MNEIFYLGFIERLISDAYRYSRLSLLWCLFPLVFTVSSENWFTLF